MQKQNVLLLFATVACAGQGRRVQNAFNPSSQAFTVQGEKKAEEDWFKNVQAAMTARFAPPAPEAVPEALTHTRNEAVPGAYDEEKAREHHVGTMQAAMRARFVPPAPEALPKAWIPKKDAAAHAEDMAQENIFKKMQAALRGRVSLFATEEPWTLPEDSTPVQKPLFAIEADAEEKAREAYFKKVQAARRARPAPPTAGSASEASWLEAWTAADALTPEAWTEADASTPVQNVVADKPLFEVEADAEEKAQEAYFKKVQAARRSRSAPSEAGAVSEASWLEAWTAADASTPAHDAAADKPLFAVEADAEEKAREAYFKKVQAARRSRSAPSEAGAVSEASWSEAWAAADASTPVQDAAADKPLFAVEADAAEKAREAYFKKVQATRRARSAPPAAGAAPESSTLQTWTQPEASKSMQDAAADKPLFAVAAVDEEKAREEYFKKVQAARRARSAPPAAGTRPDASWLEARTQPEVAPEASMPSQTSAPDEALFATNAADTEKAREAYFKKVQAAMKARSAPPAAGVGPEASMQEARTTQPEVAPEAKTPVQDAAADKPLFATEAVDAERAREAYFKKVQAARSARYSPPATGAVQEPLTPEAWTAADASRPMQNAAADEALFATDVDDAEKVQAAMKASSTRPESGAAPEASTSEVLTQPEALTPTQNVAADKPLFSHDEDQESLSREKYFQKVQAVRKERLAPPAAGAASDLLTPQAWRQPEASTHVQNAAADNTLFSDDDESMAREKYFTTMQAHRRARFAAPDAVPEELTKEIQMLQGEIARLQEQLRKTKLTSAPRWHAVEDTAYEPAPKQAERVAAAKAQQLAEQLAQQTITIYPDQTGKLFTA